MIELHYKKKEQFTNGSYQREKNRRYSMMRDDKNDNNRRYLGIPAKIEGNSVPKNDKLPTVTVVGGPSY